MIAMFAFPKGAHGGMPGTILIGVGGAVVAGLVGTVLGLDSVTELEFRSVCLAACGPIAPLFGFKYFLDRAEA
jgi:uncharacterized membrane protein YeaQ/YmgE (transglycosylase-associated protein family)